MPRFSAYLQFSSHLLRFFEVLFIISAFYFCVLMFVFSEYIAVAFNKLCDNL